MLVSVYGTGTNQLHLNKENAWDSVEFVTLMFDKKYRQKPTGVLQHRRE
jgi:hypothetical protein